jgi:hypothetical protein
VIGQVREGVARVLARDGKQVKELEPFTRDEILKIFQQKNGMMEEEGRSNGIERMK